MGPDRDRTRDPWICSQTRICCQTRYRLRYAAALWLPAEKGADLLALLCEMFSSVLVTFQCGVLGQVWY